ncbi:tubulin tyrosine ligase-like 12 [Arctopsyche grandis]|uniref:tubulin tyrosine ligase-like 12 n=1 Tax=Arctopsyche grandis TaxID=121162 RepID=UPI00406D95AE
MDGIGKEVPFIAAHRPQLQLSGVPEHFWPLLCKKLSDQIFDAGDAFSLLLIDYEDSPKQYHDPTWTVQTTRNMNASDSTQIFLIDHAWTFRTHLARQQLRQVPALVQRLSNLIGLPDDPDVNEEELIQKIFDNIWKYAQTYSLNTENISTEDSIPIWYIMDELGSGIQHSDEPNFRCVPFIHLPEGVTYSLLFPVRNVKAGDIVTRNYIENLAENEEHRRAMLLPWQEYEESDDYTQNEPDKDYFLSGHIEESLPDTSRARAARNPDQILKVFSEYPRINENLTHPRFEIVDNEQSADILWFTGHFKMYKELSEISPDKFVNQFPFENVLTIKDLLCVIARRSTKDCNSIKDSPAWLPKTFNLKSELDKFISYYRKRESLGLDNHWICKPFNLARGLDTHITDNINFIVRLPLTGPKIAQKYIENPVLFYRPDCESKVKFDVRYVILLKSVHPLRLYVYKNFFLRFSNKAFALNNFDEYEQHFTVMNYGDTNLFRMMCADFVTEWHNQYDGYNWTEVENNIYKMLRELFERATMKPAPCGIAESPQSRALYAADIMLAWDKNDKGETIIQPKLLEVNWMPDCNRACQYYPQFYNDIFSMLFLDEEPETCKDISTIN